jgi:hypothetical protein
MGRRRLSAQVVQKEEKRQQQQQQHRCVVRRTRDHSDRGGEPISFFTYLERAQRFVTSFFWM